MSETISTLRRLHRALLILLALLALLAYGYDRVEYPALVAQLETLRGFDYSTDLNGMEAVVDAQVSSIRTTLDGIFTVVNLSDDELENALGKTVPTAPGPNASLQNILEFLFFAPPARVFEPDFTDIERVLRTWQEEWVADVPGGPDLIELEFWEVSSGTMFDSFVLHPPSLATEWEDQPVDTVFDAIVDSKHPDLSWTRLQPVFGDVSGHWDVAPALLMFQKWDSLLEHMVGDALQYPVPFSLTSPNPYYPFAVDPILAFSNDAIAPFWEDTRYLSIDEAIALVLSRQRTDDASLSLSGIRLEGNPTLLGGATALFVTMLYLVMYLTHLKTAIRDSGITASKHSWIGLMEGYLPKGWTLASFTLGPLCVGTFLLIRAFRAGVSSIWLIPSALLVAGSIAIGAQLVVQLLGVRTLTETRS